MTPEKTRLLDQLDLVLDVLAMLVFNIGFKLRSERLMRVNQYIPTADRIVK